MMEMDRRSFVKTSLVAGAASAGVCSVAMADAPTEEAEMTYDIVEEIDCDVLVCGAGVAGLATALRCKEQGLGRVVLVEKRPAVGGTASLAGGIFAVESSMQKEMGIEVTKDDIFRKCVNYHNWANNAAILRRFVDASANVFEWLKEEGVTFDSVERTGLSEITWHIPTGRMAGLCSVLDARCQEVGVEIMCDTAAKELLMADGKVAGAIAVQEGGAIQFNTPVVVVCTGGYADNAEMFEQYTGWDYSRWTPLGFEGRDGDGIKMGLSAGAVLHIPGAVMVCGYTIAGYDAYSDPIAMCGAKQPCVWVNENAIRFADESIQGNFAAAGAASATVNDVYAIVDTSYVEMLATDGLVFGVNNIYATGTPLEGFYEQFEEAYAVGDPSLYKADSLAELAEAIGIPADALEATFAEYNTYAETGDPVFLKEAQYCQPMTTPPYYAFKLERTFFTTVGGLKIDTECRVIGADGQPISGLYAGGSDNGGLYGYQYDVLVAAGSQAGWGPIGATFIADSVKEYLGV